jgi:small GTP-binding protein
MDKIRNVFDYDYIFKIIFLGNTAVGKTSIVRRLREKGFRYEAEPTIGLDFTALYGKITQGKNIKFHIWDTAGQENFASIVRTYYRGVASACIVIDISDMDALDHASKWLKSYNNLKSPNSVGLPIIIGNKTDLQRQYTYEEGERWANENGCLYWEMSALNNENTAGLLYFIGNNIFNNWDGESEVAGIVDNNLKKNLELGRERSESIFKTCCRII